MTSSAPANVTFSLGVFGERGGRFGPHKDGWGIAFKEEHDFRLVKEGAPAAASACLRFLQAHDIQSEIVLSHLRLATVPSAASYTNTHPFARELGGHCHVFAHNGSVPGVFDDPRFAPKWNFPLGQTDSEWAFCALMDRLRYAVVPGEAMNIEKKLPVIQQWATELAQHGTINFLLSDSEYLYAHRSTNLFFVQRQCLSELESLASDSFRVAVVGASDRTQRISLIATQPLSAHEQWTALALGEVAVFRRGERIVL